MGADWYGTLSNGAPIGIGRNCRIEGAIIDKNSSIGDNVVIKPFPENTELNGDYYYVRDGIVIIPKHTVLPAGTIIQPDLSLKDHSLQPRIKFGPIFNTTEESV